MGAIANRLSVIFVATAFLVAAAIFAAPEKPQVADPSRGMVLVSASGEVYRGGAAVSEYRRIQGCLSRCKVVVIDAARMPFIARNIDLAQGAGKPGTLTRAGTAVQRMNRAAACGTFIRRYGGECDEYPFASSRQGGVGSRTEEVPPREQRCQGGLLSAQYRSQGIKEGDDFGVLVSNLDAMAKAPYTGTETARERNCGR